MTGREKPRGNIWRIVLYFIIVTAFFYAVIAAAMPKYRRPSTPQEIESADLSKEYICIDATSAQTYAGKLYTSEDFAGKTPESGEDSAKYRTYRIVLPLKPGVTYGITGQTATYAQRVYVDGTLLSAVGTVSDSAEDFTPHTDVYTAYFTAQNDETEIIVQHAWFNHRSGALHKLFIAEQQVISRMERAQTMCDGVITGALIAIALFFFGMFLLSPGNRAMLWFSLSGLCAAANYLIYESKQIMVFFPRISWYAAHKIECLTNIWYLAFVLTFAFTALHCRPGKRFMAVSFSLLAAATLFFAAAPSTLYTRYTVPVGVAMLIYGLCALTVLLRMCISGGKLRTADSVIVCLSPLLTLIVYAVEGVTYFSHIFYLRSYLMILLALCNALALTIGYSRTERLLGEAQRRELEIAEENAMLEKMNRLKNEFMRNIAHEMKTPLTVMSGYAQLTGRQIQRGVLNEESAANLSTVAREAERLSDMVTKLLDVTYHGVGEGEASRFAVRTLLDDAAAVCRPVLLKNGNGIRLLCETGKSMYSNKEALLQVLINLAVNSGKHTHDGMVTVSAEECGGMINFSVADNGSGIAAQDLPHIFESGYSTDGGNGLGLTICRDIIEAMGGTIEVYSTGTQGTTVRFTVPDGEEAQA